MNVYLGIDIGSTTVKLVAAGVNDATGRLEILYRKYERHFSKVREKACEMLRDAKQVIGDANICVAITGSAGLGVAKASGVDFVQEVFATRKCVGTFVPKADVVIELGGEDAKIVFLTGQLEERMNGSCAGGTGAFIDQMAVLLDVQPNELDALSLKAERIYTIASRCGVFAKSDIQPLLNEGARKEDVAASIFQAVVNQTVAGLAQGREIEGDVVFLGGPLFFFKGLQKRFQETLMRAVALCVLFLGVGGCLQEMRTRIFRNWLRMPLLPVRQFTQRIRRKRRIPIRSCWIRWKKPRIFA